MVETYREQFQDEKRAKEYAESHYAVGTYADLLWRIEQRRLERIVRSLRSRCDRIDHLDFACGAGRVAARLEPLVDSSTAIDIAEPMLRIARDAVKAAEIVQGDLSTEAELLPGPFDLITAFRFILNAEPELRVRSMRAMASRLRDNNSIIVFNNHGNPLSHKCLMWPVHMIRRQGTEYRSEGNYMTHEQVTQLAREVGLRIIDRFGYGHLSAKALQLLPFGAALRMEQALAGAWWLQRLGVNQLYIAARA